MRSFDYSVLKNRTWDNEILGLVAQIHEYKGRQELYLKQKPAELDKLVEIAKIQSTEASNEIEGIRTTNTRLKQLVADKTTPRNRDEEEIMGYRGFVRIIFYSFIVIYSGIRKKVSGDNLRIRRITLAQRIQKDMNSFFSLRFRLMRLLLRLKRYVRATIMSSTRKK